MTSPSHSPIAAVNDRAERSPVLLPPLPDPVGYAGNFAVIMEDQLVTGGGSQFPEKPLWLEGQKAYSDRIFFLSKPEGAWRESSIGLPRKMAHFAFASSTEALYLAGGMAEDGLIKEAFELRLVNGEPLTRKLPDLPKAVAYATGTWANERFYIAGGQHDPAVKSATGEVWSLDTNGPDGWRREPDLPGIGAFVGATASDGKNLYFIGGVGFESGVAVQSGNLHRLSPEAKEWESLPAMPEPRVGPVTPCPIIDGNRIFVMGGYAGMFTGERRDHPGFSRQTFIYDIAKRTWSRGPLLPHEGPVDKDSPSDPGPAPMVAAPGIVWNDLFVAVGGEVRASVRTPAVVAYPLSSL